MRAAVSSCHSAPLDRNWWHARVDCSGELTRIEARIDKQLKRSEMSDMQLVNEKYTPLTETGEPAKPPPVPGKRGKRYRRGL